MNLLVFSPNCPRNVFTSPFVAFPSGQTPGNAWGMLKMYLHPTVCPLSFFFKEQKTPLLQTVILLLPSPGTLGAAELLLTFCWFELPTPCYLFTFSLNGSFHWTGVPFFSPFLFHVRELFFSFSSNLTFSYSPLYCFEIIKSSSLLFTLTHLTYWRSQNSYPIKINIRIYCNSQVTHF